MMSEQWPVKTLDELINEGLITLGRGKIISRKDLAATPGNFPVYSSAKMNEGKFGEYGLHMFDEELITWSIDGGGRLFHREKHKFSVTNVGGTLRINDTSRLDYKFLYYCLILLHSKINFDWVKKAHPSIIRKLYNEIPVPPLEEQRRIVSILDEAFENISVKLSNAEENMFQAENLFSNELETVFSQRHENWNEMKLDEIGNIQTGTTPKTSERENYGDYISFIKPAAFAKDGAIIHTDDRLSEIGYGKSRPVKPFSVLMVCIGATIGKCGYNVVEVTTNQQINSLTPKNAKLYKFLYYQMLTRKFQHSVVTNAGQSTLPCLSKSKWSKLSLLVPTDDDEIQSIISRFNNLRNECDFLRGKYKRTKNSLVELKQSILQEAFIGKLTKEITA